MNSSDVIELIKEWLIDVTEGRLTSASFVQVVVSLIDVYERGEDD